MFKRVPIGPGELPRVSHIKKYEPIYEIELSVMGQPLTFGANDSQLIEAALDTFGRFPPHTSSYDPLIVHVFIRDSMTDSSAGDAGVERPQTISVHNQGHLVLLSV
jgi:hypothetical protein